MTKITLVAAALLIAATAFAQQAAKPAAKPAAGGAAGGAAPAKPAEPAKAAVPAQPPAPAMPKPPAEMADLKWMLGTWKCSGTAAAGPMNPKEHKFTSMAKAKMDLDNFWFSVRYEEKKSKEHPMPVKVNIFWSYDSAQKKWVAAMVDNFGAWMTGTSAGWQGDKMEWAEEGMMTGMGKFQARESFVKKSDKEFTQRFEMNMGKGWMPMGENLCKK